jgi:hypothetical protein
MRDGVTRMEERLDLLVRKTKDAHQSLERAPSKETVRWLVALERSHATEAVHPTEILRAIDEALPLDARILSLRLEALAGAAPSAADFVFGLSKSSLVRDVEILEERHQSDGEIFLRIEADLGSGSTK